MLVVGGIRLTRIAKNSGVFVLDNSKYVENIVRTRLYEILLEMDCEKIVTARGYIWNSTLRRIMVTSGVKKAPTQICGSLALLASPRPLEIHQKPQNDQEVPCNRQNLRMS